jgi:hypothetical protein
MDNKIYLPKPCSEKWDNMTPIERGKLCEICNRKVYDLTKMNNTEIISLINSEERVCGKIAITQLNKRPYSLKKLSVLISFSSVFSFSNLLYSNPNNQLTTPKFSTIQNIQQNYDLNQIKNDSITIFGIVRERKIPFPKAIVKIKGTTIQTETDFDGNFELKIPYFTKNNEPVLEISYIGMITKEVKIKNSKRRIKVEIESKYYMGEVIYKNTLWRKFFG